MARIFNLLNDGSATIISYEFILVAHRDQIA